LKNRKWLHILEYKNIPFYPVLINASLVKCHLFFFTSNDTIAGPGQRNLRPECVSQAQKQSSSSRTVSLNGNRYTLRNKLGSAIVS
jgi:hypothetical protein